MTNNIDLNFFLNRIAKKMLAQIKANYSSGAEESSDEDGEEKEQKKGKGGEEQEEGELHSLFHFILVDTVILQCLFPPLMVYVSRLDVEITACSPQQTTMMMMMMKGALMWT